MLPWVLALSIAATPVAPVPERGALPGQQVKKHTNILIAAGSFVVGTALAYGGLALGILGNIRAGGLSNPPDVTDAMLLAVLPAGCAAAGAWLIGLFDWGQRGVVSSALWSVLGALVGEAAGLGVGILIGRSAAPNDVGLSGIITISVAPGFAALGSVVLMELLKSGEVVPDGAPSASLMGVRDSSGQMVFGPSLVGSF